MYSVEHSKHGPCFDRALSLVKKDSQQENKFQILLRGKRECATEEEERGYTHGSVKGEKKPSH